MSKLVGVDYHVLACIFEKDGFVYSRTKGDHIIYTKHGIARPIVIPKYACIPVFIIKNLLRTAQMTRERYFQLLEYCK